MVGSSGAASRGRNNTETSVSRASYLGENPPNPVKGRTGAAARAPRRRGITVQPWRGTAPHSGFIGTDGKGLGFRDPAATKCCWAGRTRAVSTDLGSLWGTRPQLGVVVVVEPGGLQL